MNREIASMILVKGKTLAPDRFPAIPGEDDPEGRRMLLDAWRESLSIVALPAEVWSAAVTMWATSMVEDRMVTPRDLIRAAYAVRDRWEQHPERKKILDEYRAARLNANYARMGLEPVPEATLELVEVRGALPAGDGPAGMGRLGEVLRFERRGDSAQNG